jgi:hypothetical protein
LLHPDVILRCIPFSSTLNCFWLSVLTFSSLYSILVTLYAIKSVKAREWYSWQMSVPHWVCEVL